MRFLAALVLAALPIAASAQSTDVAAEFREAFKMFYPGGDSTPQAAMLEGLKLIQGIEGRWIPAQLAFLDGEFDTDRASKFCDQAGFDLAPKGRFGFTMTHIQRGMRTDAVVTYSFAGGNAFARTADLEGYAAFLFGDRDLSKMPPGMVLNSLIQPDQNGHALVHRYSANVLVIEGVATPPGIYTRCPGEPE